LGNSAYQKDVIGRAQRRGVQPVRILQEDSAGTETPTSEFDRAPPNVQQDINQVFANFGVATAAYESTIRTEDSAFDRFADLLVKTGQPQASYVDGFRDKEWNGFKVFVGEGGCVLCHHGPDFTDHEFHNIGLPAQQNQGTDLGRAQGILLAKNSPFFCGSRYFQHLNALSEACVESQFAETENSEWIGAFKTPTLRNLKDTAPYGHDGRFATLRDVLLHYNLLTGKPAVGHTEESLKPLAFSETQLADLEAFLLSLYGNVVTD
jgi:cytochrome c peroxidase